MGLLVQRDPRPLAVGHVVQDVVSAPFGRTLPGSVNATLLTSVGPAWVAAKLASPVAAYNVVALSGLALSGSSMYLLVRWLRLGIGPAIWAGVSLVLFPYELIRVAGHVPLAHLEAIPVVVMAGVYWIERPGVRRAVLRGPGPGLRLAHEPLLRRRLRNPSRGLRPLGARRAGAATGCGGAPWPASESSPAR